VLGHPSTVSLSRERSASSQVSRGPASSVIPAVASLYVLVKRRQGAARSAIEVHDCGSHGCGRRRRDRQCGARRVATNVRMAAQSVAPGGSSQGGGTDVWPGSTDVRPAMHPNGHTGGTRPRSDGTRSSLALTGTGVHRVPQDRKTRIDTSDQRSVSDSP
jgi:hypothetical protein